MSSTHEKKMEQRHNLNNKSELKIGNMREGEGST